MMREGWFAGSGMVMIIAPSVLTADLSDLGSDVRKRSKLVSIGAPRRHGQVLRPESHIPAPRHPVLENASVQVQHSMRTS